MENLMKLLFLACLVCLVIGIIKPSIVVRWGDLEKRTRKNVLKYYGIGLMVTFVLLCIFIPKTATTSNKTAATKTEAVKNIDESKKTETEQPKEIKKIGWTQEKGNWYYYDNDKAKTGWVKDNNKYYHISTSGIMQKDWIKDNGKDYYCDNSGVMQTGWKESNGKWYCLNTDGSMVINKTVDGYYLASNGAMQEKSVSSQSSTTNNSKDDSAINNGSNNSNETANEQGQTAYLSETGKKYHSRPNCGRMNPKNATKTTVDKAKQGHARCSKCW